MKNKFARKWKTNLSATSKRHIYRDIGTDIDCCTLDEALALIEGKNNMIEINKAQPRKRTIQDTFNLAKAIGCNPVMKKRISLPKISIQEDKEY